MKRRRALAVSVLLAASMAVGACGVGERVAGVRPVPSEAVGGAPLDTTTAAVIASRVITAATSAAATGGTEGVTARKGAMTGHALQQAEAAVSSHTAPAPVDPAQRPPVAQVLAVSRSHDWPRYIVATTLDSSTTTRYLHVLVSQAATEPFKLSESLPMVGGASVPGLGPVDQGVEVVTNDKGLPASPSAVLTAYAKALAYPKPAKSSLVLLSDAASSAIVANAARQQASLGKLANLTQTHSPDKAAPIAFRSANGGVVMFGMMSRSDVVKLTAKAKELVLPADLAKLLGKSKVTKSATVVTLEPVCLVVSTTGPATVIGMAEQIKSISGS